MTTHINLLLSHHEINERMHASVAAYQSGDKNTAQRLCSEILEAMPTNPYALNLLAVLTLEAKHFDAAINLLEQLLILHPHMAQAQTNLHVCLERMGHYAIAENELQEAYLQRQLAYAKRFDVLKNVDQWLQLAFYYYQEGRLLAAIEVYRDAELHGCTTEHLYSNWGAHLQDLGDWPASEVAYKKALTLNPHYPAALYNLGHLVSLQHRHTESEALLRKAIEVSPDYGDAHLCLGTLLAQAGRLKEAMLCIQKAKQLMPTSPLPEAGLLFNQAYDPSATAVQMLACALRYAALLAPDAHFEAPSLRPKNDMFTALKIGFVRGDFKDHPVGYFTENLLKHANRAHFEWHLFSNYESSDHVASRLRALATSWTPIANQSDELVKSAIEAKHIDVLFDLSGHTALHRLSLFAKRAAPVQVSWLGWHDTTGMPNMDYLLTDHASMPPLRQRDGKPYLSEQALYLPRTRMCMMPPVFDASVDLSIQTQPALRTGFITFGSMQVLAKLSDVSLKLWAIILQRIPTAQLLIRTKQFREVELLRDFRQHAAALGLPMDRVQLLSPLGRGDYLAAYADIDILLDSYPYPGGTTTAEALWMGVPTITMGGNTMISNQGVSLLTAAGLPNWIAKSSDDYISKAVYWSEHLEALAQLRCQLRAQVANTALFDGEQFARDFEAAVVSIAR
jgi:protein O-GlcNAc transferase